MQQRPQAQGVRPECGRSARTEVTRERKAQSLTACMRLGALPQFCFVWKQEDEAPLKSKAKPLEPPGASRLKVRRFRLTFSQPRI